MFGAGFAVALVVILFVAFPIVFSAKFAGQPTTIDSSNDRAEVDAPPPITPGNEYLGSSTFTTGAFVYGDTAFLASGPGRIGGMAKADGKPVAGLRLRLALNGKVWSQWTTTGPDGRYEIAVPFGEYRVDGYELNINSANAVLPGKIGHPDNCRTPDTFTVADAAPGIGPELAFADPVMLDMPKHRFSVGDEVVIHWKPFAGAREYAVQVVDWGVSGPPGRGRHLFSSRNLPTVRAPVMKLEDFGFDPMAGHKHTVEVEAKSDAGHTLSKTFHRFRDFDFEVVQ